MKAARSGGVRPMMLALMQKDGRAAGSTLLEMDATKQQKFCMDPAGFVDQMGHLIQRSLRPRPEGTSMPQVPRRALFSPPDTFWAKPPPRIETSACSNAIW